MQFKSTLAFLTVLSAVASSAVAGPVADLGEIVRRQPGCVLVHFPDNCPASAPKKCDGSGSVKICCPKCP
ncbi:hypothetical protein AAF712_003451 [Marasmius tenuissimus]|uniref:Uncharacterized protein n=1 Tax=Marasmius tenuissimus TaxID=585030 RepID=A0ABR3A616_9AGAR|nr:hypothetical protein PM082_003931 [Marasmius tenuissimus]